MTLCIEDLDDIISDVRATRCFGRSERQMRLFEYLLQHALSKTAPQVTQYSIALDVLGRPESFDAGTDSIVRVEMHRLRANIEVYNNSKSAYKLSLPSASFDVIVSRRKTEFWAFLTKKPLKLIIASVSAVAVLGIGISALSTTSKKSFSLACSEQIPNLTISQIGESSETKNYVQNVLKSTMIQHTGFNIIDANQLCGSYAAPVFDIQIILLAQNEKFNLALNVVDEARNSIVESYHISGKIDGTREDTAFYYKITETANSIALRSGTLARYAYGGKWGSAPYQKSYGCLIAMYDSFAGELDQEFENVHSCLERSVESGAATLDNYGALASSYLDQARNKRNSTVDNPIIAAENIFKDHGSRWLDSNEIAIAKMYYEAERSDFNSERMMLTLETIKTRYSTNPQVLLVAAAFYGYSLGRWDDAKALSDYVKKIYTIRDQSVFVADAGYAFMGESPNRSMDDCYKFYGENSVFVNIIVNACARIAQNSSWIDLTESNLNRLNMSDHEARIAYLETRIQDFDYKQRVQQALSYN